RAARHPLRQGRAPPALPVRARQLGRGDPGPGPGCGRRAAHPRAAWRDAGGRPARRGTVRPRMERVLTSLADGTLPAWRRPVVLRRVARWEELSRALADQRFAVAVVRARGDPAPPRLRAWIERATVSPSGRPRRRRARAR